MNERLMDCAMATDYIPAKQSTILLVEDDERVRRALHLFLQREGYKAIGVGSVAEAEECIAKIGIGNIAAIISDIDLDPVSKELEGYSFFRRWTAEHPALPFILISGDYTVWDLPAVRTKAACFLVKPFSRCDLLTALRSALRKRIATGLVMSRNEQTKTYMSGKEKLK